MGARNCFTQLNMEFSNEKLEFRGSRLTRLLYSQNIQCGPPLGGVSWKWPKVTFHMSISLLHIWFFVIITNQNRYANELLDMHIWWRQTAWVLLVPINYPHTKFHQCSPYRTLDIWFFFVISLSEQICKWGIKYAHLVTTHYMGSVYAHHYPHTKLHQCTPYKTPDIYLIFCY